MTFGPGAAAVAFPLGAAVALGASFLLVTRLERLAGRLHLTEAMLGLAVALAADSPEITSAVSASAHGHTAIGAGVVLGSNVFNLASLLGLGALIANRIDLHRRVVVFEGTTAVWVAGAALMVVAVGAGAGVGLLVVLAAVVPYVMISASRALTGPRLSGRIAAWLRAAVEEEEAELSTAIALKPGSRSDVPVAVGSVAAVVVASTVMERSAETLGTHLGLSDFVVGAVVLAAVTSLPNAVGAVVLALRGRASAVLSEAMNSNMLNVVVGLFVPGIIFGLSTGTGSLLAAVWYLGLTVLSLAMACAGRGLSRPQGLVIVAGYAAFVAVAVTR